MNARGGASGGARPPISEEAEIVEFRNDVAYGRYQTILGFITKWKAKSYLDDEFVKEISDKARLAAYSAVWCGEAPFPEQISLEWVDYTRDLMLWRNFAPEEIKKPFPFEHTKGPQVPGNDWRFRAPYDQGWPKRRCVWEANEFLETLEPLLDPRPAALQAPTVDLKEAARRERLEKQHQTKLTCLDVWPYGSSITKRTCSGSDQSKLKVLWEEVYGDAEPVIPGCYFALPALNEFGDVFSMYHLEDTYRFLDVSVRLKTEAAPPNLGFETMVVLTLRNNTQWVERTIDASARAWFMLVEWFRKAVDFAMNGTHAVIKIDESFSVSQQEYRNWMSNQEVQSKAGSPSHCRLVYNEFLDWKAGQAKGQEIKEEMGEEMAEDGGTVTSSDHLRGTGVVVKEDGRDDNIEMMGA